eukprot:10849597-Alexandrium_andersonii.AAC.1
MSAAHCWRTKALMSAAPRRRPRSTDECRATSTDECHAASLALSGTDECRATRTDECMLVSAAPRWHTESTDEKCCASPASRP